MKQRTLSLLLALVMVLGCVPAWAEDEMTFTTSFSIPLSDYSTTEALEGFAYQKMYGAASTWGVSARRMLSDPMKLMYDWLKPEVQKVANGNRSSTQFVVTKQMLESYGLEVSFAYTTDDERTEKMNAMTDALCEEFSALIDAIKADCPFDLYWADYNMFMYSSIGWSGYGKKLSVSEASINVYVNHIFQKDSQFSVSAAAANAAKNASAKAKSIVAAAAGKSDYEKLVYYADQIMALTAYNDEAAADQNFINSNSNPWQLIYVFDGDPDTNVVCEGYAKAFMYLCDLTTFNSDMVCCITVTGLMSGGTGEGPHMWEVVRMEDGWNYLVDVTNSEFGTIGQGGEFILGGTSGSGDTYIFDTIGTAFTYDSNQPYSEDDLVLAPGKYRPVYTAGNLTGQVGSREVLAVLASQTVPKGETLVNNGYLHFVNGNTLTVNGTFTNNNAIFVGDTKHTCTMGETFTALDATHHLKGNGCTVSGCPIVYQQTAIKEAHVFENGKCACGYVQTLPVTITGKDAEFTFNGSPYDVSSLFTVDANAGEATYSLVSGSATLNGTQLSIQACGPLVIRIQTAENGAYAAGEATATLTVLKGTPSVTAPTGLTATYGDTLSDVALLPAENGTWAWVDAAASVGDAGTQTHKATFTPADTANWNSVTVDVALAVAKADPSVTAPTGLTATYGDTLSDVALPTAENGTWAWVDAAASVGVAGTQTHKATFTPADTANWNSVTVDVAITVAPAPLPATPGDVNDSVTVDVRDALMLLRYVTGQDVQINPEAADVNNDGSVNASDSSLLLQYLAERGITLK